MKKFTSIVVPKYNSFNDTATLILIDGPFLSSSRPPYIYIYIY